MLVGKNSVVPLHGYKFVTHRIMNKLCQGMEAKLDHYLISLRLGGPQNNSEGRSNLFVSFSRCKKSNDFDLTGSWLATQTVRLLRWISGPEK
jgi:hypothetical protein